MHFLGVWGMPRRIYTYAPGMGWDFWNGFETGCAYLLFISFAVFGYNVIQSLFYGEKAEADPWDARTLEWATPSPPPAYNFESIPMVRGRDAFWVAKYGVMVEGHGHSSQPAHGETSGAGAPAVAEHLDTSGHGTPHMPAPSLYPLLFALGLVVGGAGALMNWIRIDVLAGLLLFFAIIGMAFSTRTTAKSILIRMPRPTLASTIARPGCGRSSAPSACFSRASSRPTWSTSRATSASAPKCSTSR